MRKLIAALLTTVIVGVTVVAAAPQSASAPLTVDQILAKYFQARGGLDKWHAVQTMKMTGHATAQGYEVPILIYSKRPNLSRQEITVAPGQVNINAFDGTTAWVKNAQSPTPIAIAGPQAETVKQQADFDGALVDYKAKGTRVELVGIETAGPVRMYHLKVTRKNGLVEDDYIDTALFTEVKAISQPTMNGASVTLETQMSNYKEFGGILIATRLRSLSNGVASVEMNLDKVEINLPLDDALFKMPVK